MASANVVFPHARILIIDDQEANVAVLVAMLEQAGYTNLSTVSDSLQAVARCLTIQPDLILLDLHMPHLDGFAVMEQLQGQWPEDNSVPILVLTADITIAARRQALEMGAQDFVSKPFDRVEVLLRIRNLLRTRALRRSQQDLHQALVANVSDLVCIVDAIGTIRYASSSYQSA